MKSRAVKIFLCIIFFLGLTPIGSAENLPNEMFRIGKIELGKTTFGEIEKNHGNAKSFRTSKDDGADEYICYIQKHGKSKQYIVFETGEMGGYKQVIGFRISTNKPHISCNIATNELSTETGNGVSIGQSYEKFVKRFSINFKDIKKSRLTYENISQREATTEELVHLRKVFPNEKETRFDVTVTINAQFKQNNLIDYYVRKIESY